MTRLNSLVIFNGVVAGGLLLLGVGTASCGSQLQNYASTEPVKTPFGAKALAAELVACPDDFRPLRVAFVVDNTGSNGAKPGDVQRESQPLKGSDPLRTFDDAKYLLKGDADFAGLNTENVYTYRQYAVYKAIRKLQTSGLAARKNNPKYEGIDIGIAHFPKAESEVPTELEMSEPVYYFGGNTGLQSKMTDVSQIAESPTFNQQIWDTLKFTHKTNGMTPYVTAFTAAQNMLIAEKKAEDKRQGLMIIVTDGLPTDRVPSAIKAARKALGADTRVVLMSIYGDDNINDEEQNKAPKEQLASLFKNDSFKWGQEEHSSFDSYWNALLAIPNSNEVRDDFIKVNSNKLKKSVDELLDRYLKCKKK
ncbi:MAG: hypothetical protein RLZZ488_2278 [Pseudomonadota bacterium]|jgi:hypothetical protein